MHHSCLSLLPRIKLFFNEVPCLRMEMASRRKTAAISRSLPLGIRLLSSPNVTSRDQCNEFSIGQWPRRCLASRFTDAGGLLMKNTTSCESLPHTSRSWETMQMVVALVVNCLGRFLFAMHGNQRHDRADQLQYLQEFRKPW